jgi:hypothetical protein
MTSILIPSAPPVQSLDISASAAFTLLLHLGAAAFLINRPALSRG